MKKILIPIITVLIIGTIVGLSTLHRTSRATTTTVHKSRVIQQPQPITETTIAKQPALKYSCIIYYAIKHLKIQRWQEVSDFSLGWQVEIYTDQGKLSIWFGLINTLRPMPSNSSRTGSHSKMTRSLMTALVFILLKKI
ncbi:hypothetical protein ACLOCO_09795 [Lactiplantibacillus plantarum]|uniref:hypothetical protein n=1 Tax=Lactiplantibacillus plantarum TaxID=1590 RepID=UPI003EBAAC55